MMRFSSVPVMTVAESCANATVAKPRTIARNIKPAKGCRLEFIIEVSLGVLLESLLLRKKVFQDLIGARSPGPLTVFGAVCLQVLQVVAFVPTFLDESFFE